MFLAKLVGYLDVLNPGWRNSTLIMIDNAPYHRSKSTQEFLSRHCIPVMFLGPYQFSMAPVEKFFAFFKGRDLNPLLIKAFSK
jgi:hypothetical protein